VVHRDLGGPRRARRPPRRRPPDRPRARPTPDLVLRPRLARRRAGPVGLLRQGPGQQYGRDGGVRRLPPPQGRPGRRERAGGCLMGNEGVIVAVAVLLGLWGASRAKTFTGKIGVLLAVVVTVALAVSAYRRHAARRRRPPPHPGAGARSHHPHMPVVLASHAGRDTAPP